MTIVKSIMLNNELVVRLPQSLDILENQEFYFWINMELFV